MFAIIRTGGKQYKVTKDALVFVEKLPEDVGNNITFTEVLMVDAGAGTNLGNPLVAGAAVVAHVQDQMRTKKVLIFKKKRRHQYRRKKGHRQHQTVLRILDITLNGKSIFPEGASPRPTGRAVAGNPAIAAEVTGSQAKPVAKEKPAVKVGQSDKDAVVTKPAGKKASVDLGKETPAKTSTKKSPAKAESPKQK